MCYPIFQSLLTLALYILIGYFAGRSGLFSKSILKLLFGLEISVFLPAYVLNILVQFWKIDLSSWLARCVSETADCLIPIAMIWIGFVIYYFTKE